MANKEKPKGQRPCRCPLGCHFGRLSAREQRPPFRRLAPCAGRQRAEHPALNAARLALFRCALAAFLPPAAAGQHAHEQLYVLDVIRRKGVFGLGIGAEQLGGQRVHLFGGGGGCIHGRALAAGKPCFVHAQSLCQKAQAARLGAEIALEVLAHGAFGDAGGAAQVCLAQMAHFHSLAQTLRGDKPFPARHAAPPLSDKSVHRARGHAAPAAVHLL